MSGPTLKDAALLAVVKRAGFTVTGPIEVRQVYTNRIGVTARVLGMVNIAGEVLWVCAIIRPLDNHRIEVSGRTADSFDRWTLADRSTWDAVEADALSARLAREKAVADAIDAEAFGFKIRYGRRTWWRDAFIVRTTSTQYIDHEGGRWSRRTRRRVGESAGLLTSRISSDDADALDEWLAGRGRVDVVKERKAVAPPPSGD